MSRNLGVPGGPDVPSPPAAVRASGPGWRDPRLWIGVVLVAASVVVGSRVMASADDTVQVWAVASDVAAGQPLTEADLEPRRVRFADGEVLERYVPVDDDLPADVRAGRALGAGELLPAAALGGDDGADLVEVSIEVSPGLVPTAVGPGSVVDVFLVAPGRGRGGEPTSGPDLAAVSVVDAPTVDAGLAPSGLRQLVLAVEPDDAPEFYARLGELDAPVVYVARHDG